MRVVVIVEDFGAVVVRAERSTDRLRAKHIREACEEAIETLVLTGSVALAEMAKAGPASDVGPRVGG
jgi:hypothetical protein